MAMDSSQDAAQDMHAQDQLAKREAAQRAFEAELARNPVLLTSWAMHQALEWTPLHLAAAIGFGASAKRLLAAGFHPNARTRAGDTVLATACKHAWSNDYPNDRLSIIHALLAAGADPNAAGGPHRPLGIAVRIGGWVGDEISQALVEAGADPNACDEDGESPLACALDRGNVQSTKLIRRLLAAGAHPNQLGGFGSTLLAMSVQSRQHEAFQALLAAGANPMLRGSDGLLPIDVVRSLKATDFETELLAAMERHQLLFETGSAPASKAPRL